jgi:hypothetical protein
MQACYMMDKNVNNFAEKHLAGSDILLHTHTHPVVPSRPLDCKKGKGTNYSQILHTCHIPVFRYVAFFISARSQSQLPPATITIHSVRYANLVRSEVNPVRSTPELSGVGGELGRINTLTQSGRRRTR